MQYSLLESDAMVGVGVIRGDVDRGDLGISSLVKGFDEGVVGWGKTVVRGEDEHGAGG